MKLLVGLALAATLLSQDALVMRLNDQFSKSENSNHGFQLTRNDGGCSTYSSRTGHVHDVRTCGEDVIRDYRETQLSDVTAPFGNLPEKYKIPVTKRHRVLESRNYRASPWRFANPATEYLFFKTDAKEFDPVNAEYTVSFRQESDFLTIVYGRTDRSDNICGKAYGDVPQGMEPIVVSQGFYDHEKKLDLVHSSDGYFHRIRRNVKRPTLQQYLFCADGTSQLLPTRRSFSLPNTTLESEVYGDYAVFKRKGKELRLKGVVTGGSFHTGKPSKLYIR